MRHGRDQVDQKTKANARANPYMIILCGGTTTTSAPLDVVLELVLSVVENDNAFKHPIDVVIAVFAPFLATTPLNGSPKQCAVLSDAGLVANGGAK
jgi:hypothetical protein